MSATASTFDGLLRPFSKVRAGEGAVAVLMLVCVFLILTSYYVLKTAREGLILASGTFGLGGDELKTYATGAMALLLVGAVPAYGALANRVPRLQLINLSYGLVIASLFGFFLLAHAGVAIALPFFIWLGLVSVFLIAQFWSYANDIYTEEQGTRLFAIIATGGSLGAIFGPRLAGSAPTYSLLVLGAVILGVCVALFNVIERLHSHEGRELDGERPISGGGSFSLVWRDQYLLLIACMVLVANVVNTTGEYILSNAARDYALQLEPTDPGARRELIKGFYSEFFGWVNLIGFLVQALVVSRVIQRLGVRAALFVFPIIAFGAYAMMGAVGGLAIARSMKVAANATDYSLQNTVRQTLFLPTDRFVKYKAKIAIDTFFVRAGDLMSAVVVGVGVHVLGFRGAQFAFVNLTLVALWIAISIGIARHHRSLDHSG